jgi:hypothetical protein
MAASRRWVTMTAVSALGIGVIASGAIGVARAMPLVDSTTIAEVPPISTVPDTPDESPTPAPGSSSPTPVPSSSATPTTPPEVDRAPAPAPQPVAPRPAGTASPSATTVPSPATVDDDSDSGTSGSDN